VWVLGAGYVPRRSASASAIAFARAVRGGEMGRGLEGVVVVRATLPGLVELGRGMAGSTRRDRLVVQVLRYSPRCVLRRKESNGIGNK
jgi:hypothetical protein